MASPNWFLAFPLPPEARWQEAAVTAPAGLRRLAAADLHLTLAFLGACGEERARQAWRAVEGLEGEAQPIVAGSWRALGPPRQPSAYGLTLAAGHQPLAALLRHWSPLALAAAGRPPSSRPPLPHITLLRPRRREAQQWQQPMQAWMAAAPLPRSEVPLLELALYTWAEDRSSQLFRIVVRRGLR